MRRNDCTQLIPRALAARLLLSLLVVLPVASAKQPVACGREWINIHKRNPELAGVRVQQYPDNRADKAAYEGKHPVMVVYVFKNRKAHQVSYTPEGQVQDGFWWEIPENDSIYGQLTTDLKESVSCAFWVKP